MFVINADSELDFYTFYCRIKKQNSQGVKIK